MMPIGLQFRSLLSRGRRRQLLRRRSGATFSLPVAALACRLTFAVSAADSGAASTNLTDLSLEQLMDIKVERVYSASKFEQKTTQAPAQVTVVTSDDIRKFGYRTMAEILESVPGIYTTYDRNYTYVGMRGFARPGDYNTRLLMLVDGHRINDNVYDQAFVGNEALIDVDMVERVEVLRGPGSSIYGNSALLGVVHIQTRNAAQVGGVEASASGGSFESWRGRVSVGYEFKNEAQLVASGSVFGSQGDEHLYYPEFDDPPRSDGVAVGADRERGAQAELSLKYGDFTLSGMFAQRQKEVPTASYGTAFNQDLEETIDSRAYVDLKYDREVSDATRVIGRVAYDWSRYEGTYPFWADAADPAAGLYLNEDLSRGQWLTLDGQVNQKIAGRHTLVAGVEYRENLERLQQNYDVDPSYVYTDDTRQGRNVGAYAQVELVLRTNLLLNAGFRYDYYSEFGDTWNPRAAAIWNPWMRTTFKFLYGQAFRAPNAYELYYNSTTNHSVFGSSLGPESIDTYELVYDQVLPANLQFSVAPYFYQIDDLISQQIDPGTGRIYFENLGEARAVGTEMALGGRWAPGFQARVSGVVQRTEDAETGDELTTSPRYQAKLHLVAPIYPERIFAGIEVLYYSSMLTLAGNRIDGRTQVNFTLFSRELVKGLQFSGSVYNLFNAAYAFPGAAEHAQDRIVQDGRSFRLKVTYRF